MKKAKPAAAARQSAANQTESMRRSADAPLRIPSVRTFFRQAEILFRPRVWLKNCPPGFFYFDGDFGFKTEYGTNGIEVFNSGGEVFWGGKSVAVDRDRLLVNPISIDCVPQTISRGGDSTEKSCSTCKPMASPVVPPPAAAGKFSQAKGRMENEKL